jgi:hypothetical protein
LITLKYKKVLRDILWVIAVISFFAFLFAIAYFTTNSIIGVAILIFVIAAGAIVSSMSSKYAKRLGERTKQPTKPKIS